MKTKRIRTPKNGYVVYPTCQGTRSLREARKLAIAESMETGYARVDSCDDNRTAATYRNGVERAL